MRAEKEERESMLVMETAVGVGGEQRNCGGMGRPYCFRFSYNPENIVLSLVSNNLSNHLYCEPGFHRKTKYINIKYPLSKYLRGYILVAKKSYLRGVIDRDIYYLLRQTPLWLLEGIPPWVPEQQGVAG